MTPAERQQKIQQALRAAERPRISDGHPDPAEFLKRDFVERALSEDADHMILDRSWAITPSIEPKLNIGVGDEVFITGLLANHPGEFRNTPIVRIGNLAAYPEERVKATGIGEIDAYLVEVRSRGGLSGSPVYYHAYGSPSSAYRPFAPNWLSPIEPQSFYLIGIVHGHYNQEAGVSDANRKDIEELNTGIAIVVPISQVLAFIDANWAQTGGQEVGNG